MKIVSRQVEGVTVVDLAGRLDSAVAGDVMDQLNAVVSGGASRMVVNLKELSYISSAGLRSLLVAAKLIKSVNGEMRLCEPNARVLQILDHSGFSNLLRIDNNEAESLAALAG